MLVKETLIHFDPVISEEWTTLVVYIAHERLFIGALGTRRVSSGAATVPSPSIWRTGCAPDAAAAGGDCAATPSVGVRNGQQLIDVLSLEDLLLFSICAVDP